MSPMRYFEPCDPVFVSKNRLPHWQQPGATYFVTFRLHDSLPQDRILQWKTEQKTWLRFNPRPWTPRIEREYVRRFPQRIERWLDAHHGSCVLRDRDVRRLVSHGLSHFEGKRHRQHAWVIMPNHVHVLFSITGTFTLETIVKGWKGFTAREINRINRRRGALWQKDYFDRLVRDEAHFWRCARYIRRNRRNLPATDYTLWESHSVQRTFA